MTLASIHFALSMLLFIAGTSSALAQPWGTIEEHRITSLEGSVGQLANDMKSIKDRGQWDWIEKVCIALLTTERGVNVLKNKRRPEED